MEHNQYEIDPKWFGGNIDAINAYALIIDMTHTWDDLIDRDVEVDPQEINRAFMTALFYLQMNPVYKAIEPTVLAMWPTIIASYEAANAMEKSGDEHALEISHVLRYAPGFIITHLSIYCVGYEKAIKMLPEIWKHTVAERSDAYKKEHLANV